MSDWATVDSRIRAGPWYSRTVFPPSPFGQIVVAEHVAKGVSPDITVLTCNELKLEDGLDYTITGRRQRLSADLGGAIEIPGAPERRLRNESPFTIAATSAAASSRESARRSSRVS